MSQLTFLFAVHNHQPVGNFPSVFEKAFDDCYRPLLQELSRHPSVKFTAHFSGPLWEYMQGKEKECWAMSQAMVRSGQMELLGGGFYEPILPIIPEEDRIGQIKMMSEFLEENFGVKPKGIWLAERVWEPSLPKTLNRAGIEYTLLDEEHFHYAGIKDLHHSYITEDEGCPLILFPIDKKLRYLIPFRKLEELEEYFGEIQAAGGTAILGDDGEKFGLWPGTHQWVYKEGWFKNFLSFLKDENIRTMTYSEFMDEDPPRRKVYLPPASYEEMMEWVLEPEAFAILKRLKEESPDEARRFLRGGFFREFFLKYPESDHLHKRMILISKEVNQRPSREALRNLYRGQSNDPYWHGVFGGLYLPHLREAAYNHLLGAEASLPRQPAWQSLDYDLDGKVELFSRGENFGILVKAGDGGVIAELDYAPLGRNLSDVLSRRKESYHVKREQGPGGGKSIHELAKDLPEGAAELLNYDWYPRRSLIDHFFHPDTREEDFRRIRYGEQGDFVSQGYEFFIEKNSLHLKRIGHVWISEEKVPVQIQKAVNPLKKQVTIEYQVKNCGDREYAFAFGSEWNFYQLPEEIEFQGQDVRLLGGRLLFEISPAASFWHFPLKTLSQSEEGFDIIHQGYCLLPLWKFSLKAGECFEFSIVIKEKNG